MIPDVCALMRRDHDDLDRGLVAMVDPMTPIDELMTLLDVMKLALAVHVAAEVKVFQSLLAAVPGLLPVRLVDTQSRDDHTRQHQVLDSLARTRAGSDAWYSRALELRVLVMDHAERADLARWALHDHVPPPLRRRLASDYATERLRVLARTSPVMLAREQLALRSLACT